MQILIYPGTGDGGNLGDLAMLQTTIVRLKALWPDARIRLLATGGAIFQEQFPDVELVAMRGCKRWLRVGALPGWLFPEIPAAVRAHFPLSLRNCWRLGGWAYPPDWRLAQEFANALFNADLLVLSGCGLINDEFEYAVLRLLDIFAAAISCGIPAAMMGQGFGPVENEPLRRRAAEVLPHVGGIHLREKRCSLPLLKRLGVPEEKISVTGDDAIELAFRERRPAIGTRLGFGFRRTAYSAVGEDTLAAVSRVLAEKAGEYRTDVLGIPIQLTGAASDLLTINRMMKDIPGTAGKPCRATGLVEVIRRVGECRVVVTGCYHAGVFALAQGIPVVAIAQSAYYRDKFHGLADQFPGGCQVLAAADAHFSAKLSAAIGQAWEQPAVTREQLLSFAEVQIQNSRTAYANLQALVG